MTIPVNFTPEQDKAAHRVAVEFMMLDRDQGLNNPDWSYADARMRELSAELQEIFGPDALEFSASYFTGTHASPDEIVLFAATEWELLKRIFAGVEF